MLKQMADFSKQKAQFVGCRALNLSFCIVWMLPANASWHLEEKLTQHVMPFAATTANTVSTSVSSLMPDISSELQLNSTLLTANFDSYKS